MSAPTGNRQRGRIARLLGVDATELTGLQDVPEADLAILHDQISYALFADGHAQFAKVASLSKLLPGAVAGKLAEKFLPAVLAARVAELLEPNRARDLVNRVSVGYLGDLSLVLDPVRSKPVVQAIPAPRVGEVARELFNRGEYAAMAEFVGTVTVDALFAALGVATGRDLLAVVPLLEWNDNLDHVIATAAVGQLDGVFEAMIANDLWERGSKLIDQLAPKTQQQLLSRVSELSEPNFTAIQAAAAAGKLSDTSRTLVDAAAQRRVGAV